MKDNARKAIGATRKAIWAIIGGIALILGLVGIPLPLLPTTPFLLLAAFCFGRSSDRLQHWLLGHPQLGASIRHWHQHRAISRRNKRLALVSMALIFSLSYFFFSIPGFAHIAHAVILSCVALFLFTRPSPPENDLD